MPDASNGHTNGHQRELSHKQLRAIEALLSESGIEAAADAVGVTRVTMWHWMKNPVFKAEYRTRSKQIMEQAFQRLQTSCSKAVETLEGIMLNPDERMAYARVSAAQSVLKAATQVVPLQEMTDAIAALKHDVQTLKEELDARLVG